MIKKVLIGVINFYQRFLSFDRGALAVLAPGGACRFPVSCSEYTKEQIMEKGVNRGLFLGIKRILSCR